VALLPLAGAACGAASRQLAPCRHGAPAEAAAPRRAPRPARAQDWLGLPFGARAYSRPPGRGWVQLLAPTPELWTLVLRHRTQILYIADISLVVSHLDLRPGAVVLESGTGSASLTHSLARAVAPHGRVRSFEFHELRAKEAAAELARNGLPPILASVELRNVEELGFPAEELEGAVDGVFLDLPGPWKVVPSAARCLKPDGRFCSFSPCIEQVGGPAGHRGLRARCRSQRGGRRRCCCGRCCCPPQPHTHALLPCSRPPPPECAPQVQRTCEQLDACGMTDIVTYEVLLRSYEVAEETLLIPLDADDVSAAGAAAGGGSGPGTQPAEATRPHKRARAEGGEAVAAGGPSAAAAGSEQEPSEAERAGQQQQAQQQQEQQPEQGQQQEQQQQEGEEAPAAAAPPPAAAPPAPGAGGRRRGPVPASATRAVSMVVTKPCMDARGHTGYLTFARKFV
jgi:tRNA A58 N-methylase Trm61